MRLRVPALVAAVLLATACIEPLKAPNGRYGLVSASTYDDGVGGFVLSPEAVFYGESDAGYLPFANDTCVVAPFSPNSVVSATTVTLDAGASIGLSVSGESASLTPVSSIGLRVYRSPLARGIPFTPGDTMLITVPGTPGGFPPGAVSVRTAEPFTHGAIGVPGANIDLPLTWTAAPVPGSQMTFSLRYATSFSSSGENEQVFCSFVDDGAATIDSDFLGGWRGSLNDQRSTRALRVQWREVILDDQTRLAVISSFAQPLLTLDP